MMIVVAAAMTVFVNLLMTNTVYGRKARASIQQPEMALAIGIEARRINTITFTIGCSLAGFAGAVFAHVRSSSCCSAPSTGRSHCSRRLIQSS